VLHAKQLSKLWSYSAPARGEKIQELETELEKVKEDLRILSEAKKRERYGP
jgi:hypothetical protein